MTPPTKLKLFLEENNLSVYKLAQEVAKDLKLAPQTIYKYADGTRNPTLKSAEIVVFSLQRLLPNMEVFLSDIFDFSLSGKSVEVSTNLLENEDHKSSPQLTHIGSDLVLSTDIFEQDNFYEINEVYETAYKIAYPNSDVNLVKWTEFSQDQEYYDTNASSPKINKWRGFFRNLIFASTFLGIGLYGGYLINQPEELQPPSVATPIGPEGIITGVRPTLRATNAEKASLYKFTVRNVLNDQIIISERSENPWYVVGEEHLLCPNVEYEWVVVPENIAGEADKSPAMAFTIEDSSSPLNNVTSYERPDQPVIIAPKGEVQTITPILEVNAIPHTIQYGFYIRNLTTNEVVMIQDDIKSNQYQVPTDILEDGHRYRWNSVAKSCGGNSIFSDTVEFEVNLP